MTIRGKQLKRRLYTWHSLKRKSKIYATTQKKRNYKRCADMRREDRSKNSRSESGAILVCEAIGRLTWFRWTSCLPPLVTRTSEVQHGIADYTSLQDGFRETEAEPLRSELSMLLRNFPMRSRLALCRDR